VTVLGVRIGALPGGDPLAEALHQVEAFGGRVEQLLGSTVTSLFGGHENDPERAVLAALAIRGLSGDHPPAPGAGMAAAVASGRILVRPGVSGHRPAIVGRAIDECAGQVEDVPPGTVRVSEAIYRATLRTIRYAEAAGAWTALSARTDPPREPPPALHLLAAMLANVRQAGQPHLVTLLGRAGTGKTTRLILDLLSAVGEPVPAYQARAAEPGLIALAEFGPAVARGTDPASGALALHGPETIAADLRPLGAERAVVLVFEDLHQADDTLLDLVDVLVDRAGTLPLFVVATARPELLARRPGWGGGRRNTMTLDVTSATASR
jgi:hypothetical protein